MFEEFKKFAFKGNVVDMAVGVVVGGAFGKIVTSLVSDIITPFISLLTGGSNFTELFVILNNPDGVDKAALKTIDQAKAAGCAILSYGNFIQAIIDFFIIAISIFAFVKLIEGSRKKFEEDSAKIAEKLGKKKEEEVEEEAPAEEPKPTTEDLLAEIRDLLKENKSE